MENTTEQHRDKVWTIKARSPETQLLVQCLRDAPDGALVTYDELSKVVGQSIRAGTPGYGFMVSALKIVRDQYYKTFKCQTNEGYKHFVNETEFLALAESERKRVQRACSTGLKRVSNAKIETFNAEARATLIAHMTILHLQKVESRPRNVEKIKRLASDAKDIFPAQKTLQMLIEHEDA
jgi:hypothetical protein